MLTTSKLEKTAITMPEDYLPSGITVEERRTSMRLPKRMIARLQGAGRNEVQCCTTEDVSEGGLYLCVPCEVGLCVGQRCELVLVEDDASDSSALTDEPIFATVMRTNVVVQGGRRLIGAGMRFDQPLYL